MRGGTLCVQEAFFSKLMVLSSFARQASFPNPIMLKWGENTTFPHKKYLSSAFISFFFFLWGNIRMSENTHS